MTILSATITASLLRITRQFCWVRSSVLVVVGRISEQMLALLYLLMIFLSCLESQMLSMVI